MLWRADIRGPDRVPDPEWHSMIRRVRCEFDEMPCTRLTVEQARGFFGLTHEPASRALLERLVDEGFLSCTAQGEYVRRTGTP